MKKLIQKYFILLNLFFVIVNIGFSQFDGQLNGKIISSGFYFNNLNIDWNPRNNDFDSHILNIDEFKIGFKKLKFENLSDSNNTTSNIGITGPDFIMDNLSIKSKIYSTDWITDEKIKRLERRQKVPKNAILKISDAIKLYQIDYNDFPLTLNDLHINKYINLDLQPFNDYGWSYVMNLPESIIANTTQIHPLPRSKTIHYNYQTETFKNSPEVDSLYKIPQLKWEYLFNIKNISTSFSSKIDLIINEDFTNFSLNMKRGQFKLDGASFSVTPIEYIIDHSSINLPELLLETKDFILEGSIDESPVLHSLKGTFRMRNFEIKIPEGLSNEPEIENYLERLGIWNNSFMIRLIQIEINMINEFTGDFTIKFQTPFLKILAVGNFSSQQTGSATPDLVLHNTIVKVTPIALGIRKWIRQWEKNNQELKRNGATIILNIEGPLKEVITKDFW